ncbi:N-acetylmuramoyl-L-alanine amidase [Pseudomonas sp. NPDC090203]|uniref:N-acetylmuramoyl-L-alanine amidase n=1 Tax=unclassified Pseudomonas TaxID=196821 RepID=UPI0038125CB1
MNATPPRYTPQYRIATHWLVVHCSATAPSQDIGAREITQWHIQRGFDTLGYHYVIRRDGSLETGRPENAIGAHVKGHNAKSVGVCLVGGVNRSGQPENNFTDRQFATLRRLLDQLQSRYPKARVLGHRDLSPDLNGDGKITPDEFIKACPSFDVSAWLNTR